MADALIGHTGFVGSTLRQQRTFSHFFNSANIASIRNQSFDTVFCAAAPAQKWLANENPEKDRANIAQLCSHLSACKARRMVLISTVDVYDDAAAVDEDTPLCPDKLAPYGKHRLELEHFIQETFAAHTIVRLPALFGTGLKKNFIYDLLHDNCLDWTDARSAFQFYNMARLSADCSKALDADLRTVNFAVEPTLCRDIANSCFDEDFANHTQKPPMAYDMRTKHSAVFGRSGAYIMTAAEVCDDLRAFVRASRQRKAAS